MNTNLHANEREIIKLAKFFNKKAQELIGQGKLTDEHKKVTESCEKLIEQLNAHADHRVAVNQKREALNQLIKDNAQCPQCHKANQLKLVGTEKNEKGWKCNRYRCRKCNIQFTWNRPNNPWDMVGFIEHYIPMLEASVEKEAPEKQQGLKDMIGQMHDSLAQLKAVVEATDTEFKEMEARDIEMSALISEFRKHLLIEKIKLEP
jgi:hypothetical protein